MKLVFDEIETTIKEATAATNFSLMCYTYCPKFPKDGYPLKDSDQFIMLFSRYTKRMLYFASRFVERLKVIQDKLATKAKEGVEIRTGVEDDLYFDCDAFIFSCKTLCEKKNNIKRAETLNPTVKKLLRKKLKEIDVTFVRPFLDKIRNEVVHVNYYGSTRFPTADISMKNGEPTLHIQTAFYKINKENVDLVELFLTIFIEMIKIVKAIGYFLIIHLFEEFGWPPREIVLSENSVFIFYGVRHSCSETVA